MKKSKEDEQTLEELNLACDHSQAKCQLVQTSYIKLFLFCPIIKILLTELSRSVWENLDLGRVYRPHCVRSVLTTSVKILPYRPPARLIRAKYFQNCACCDKDLKCNKCNSLHLWRNYVPIFVLGHICSS